MLPLAHSNKQALACHGRSRRYLQQRPSFCWVDESPNNVRESCIMIAIAPPSRASGGRAAIEPQESSHFAVSCCMERQGPQRSVLGSILGKLTSHHASSSRVLDISARNLLSGSALLPRAAGCRAAATFWSYLAAAAAAACFLLLAMTLLLPCCPAAPPASRGRGGSGCHLRLPNVAPARWT
ncbi:hypothetical protein BD289DRAFT_168200 [Coniella lustricola]|uniref:Uncharacterized protein n=1 Tax=Coniella lustricola TaxID=2025994 RepID=A0A2T2ZU41_9PEZI|nr:hypothetical protein BD289DRAFT_168200 [Coniella lustricola]